MAQRNDQELGQQKMNHVKADNFVEEYVDKFVFTGFHINGEDRAQFIFGRDAWRLDTESFSSISEDGSQKLTADEMTLFRHDVASLTIPLSAVRELHSAISHMLETIDEQQR